MGLMSPELSLDLKPSYVPETINGFLREVSMISDVTQRLDKVDEFVKRLEDEMNKIEVFKRELPLCMLLLKDAILTLKQESTQYRTRNAYQPVFEEFIPLRKEIIGGNNQKNDTSNNQADEEDSTKDKKNWMSSVQLWSGDNQNQTQTLVSESQKGDDKRNKFVGNDLIYPRKNGPGCKGFVPVIPSYPKFSELGKTVAKEDVGVPGLSLVTVGIKHPSQDSVSSGLNSKCGIGRMSSSSTPASNVQSNIRTGHQQPTSRKQRRCWSPELHRRFVDALTQLGGPQVATPKQIRELMHVDGLTNDEVKSHLQKYRLHTRRSPNTSANSTNDQCSDSSKPSSAQSGSPQGPLRFPGITGGTSTTGGDSMEDEEDEKSESHSWKGHVHTPTAIGKNDV